MIIGDRLTEKVVNKFTVAENRDGHVKGQNAWKENSYGIFGVFQIAKP
mgnify:FL=1